jgi:hypothetical protein
MQGRIAVSVPRDPHNVTRQRSVFGRRRAPDGTIEEFFNGLGRYQNPRA